MRRKWTDGERPSWLNILIWWQKKDGVVIGYAYAHEFYGREAYAWSVEATIYIDKDARQSGIGRILYEALERALKAMGILNINTCIAIAKDPKDRI